MNKPYKKIKVKNKKAQEEIVGFAFIVIIIAVIFLIFVGFSIRKPSVEPKESYQVDSFLQAALQYTTSCALGYEPNYLEIRKLISACNDREICLNGEDSCVVLRITLAEILEKSWPVGEESHIKGISLNITSISGGGKIMEIKDGNLTNNYRGAIQSLPEGIDVILNIHY